jgi:hypothetical protein
MIEGKLKDLSSFSNALKNLKIIAIVAIVASLFSCLSMFLIFIIKVDDFGNKIQQASRESFVIEPTSGHILRGSFKALNYEDRKKINTALVSRFVSYFYQFDGETFRDNLKTGLNYSSQEVANVFLSEYLQGEFNLGVRLKDEKMQWYVTADSIKIDMNTMEGVYYGKQKRQKPFGYQVFSMTGYFQIRELTNVSEKNEYAAVVEKWKVTKFDKIEEEVTKL